VSESRYAFEVINAQHDCSKFSSDTTFIDDYLKNYALNDTQSDIVRTYVLIDKDADHDNAVIGFFSTHAHSLAYNSRYWPVVEIPYLARHKRVRGQRVGSILLLEAFKYVIRCSNIIGVEGITLTETLEGKKLYDRFEFEPHPHQGVRDRFIHITRIRAQFEAGHNNENTGSRTKDPPPKFLHITQTLTGAWSWNHRQ